MISSYYDQRLTFLKNLKTWKTFGKGWTNRLNDGKKFANSLIDKSSTTTDKSTTNKNDNINIVETDNNLGTARASLSAYNIVVETISETAFQDIK